jgi:ABC-2 type transport system ATP-binding protein
MLVGEIMNILQTQAISKTYRKTKAVSAVSLTIQEGDIYGFIGKNGAGKTTLIRMITGVAEPTSGSFSLFGLTNPKEVIRARSQIAAVVESPALHLNLSAYDNLKMQCVLLGIKGNHKEVIEKVLTKVDLLSLLVDRKKKAKNFSLGMRQRLGIAMALVNNPKFLILDEPNNGLDPEGIKDMRILLQRLNQEDGLTILVSSHILTELSKLATRYGFIDKGKLLKEITSDELAKQSRTALLIQPSDLQGAIKALKEASINDVEVEGKMLRVYTDFTSSKLVMLLAKASIEVETIVQVRDDLETFFMNMIAEAKS